MLRIAFLKALRSNQWFPYGNLLILWGNSVPALRTKSISTKVTDEEYAQFEALAGEQTISEWARDVLLKATKPNAGEQAVLAEVLALRTILLPMIVSTQI